MSISVSWPSIPATDYDPDSPLTAGLFTNIINRSIFLYEWLGKDFAAGAVENHDHDGLNTKLIPVGPNYIRNPGFESDLGGWTQTAYSGGTIVRTTGAGNFNQGIAAVAITSSVLANGGGDILQSEFKPVRGDFAYPIRASVKASAANISSKMEVTWYDSAQAAISTDVLYTSSNTQTSFVLKPAIAKSPSTARFARLRLTGGIPSVGSSTGTIYFDDVFFGDNDRTVEPGTIEIMDCAPTQNTTSTGYVKLHEFTCGATGKLTFKFNLYTSGAQSCLGRIYINGVAVGTERSTTSNSPANEYSEDIEVKLGDVVQVYGRGTTGNLCNIDYFRAFATFPVDTWMNF